MAAADGPTTAQTEFRLARARRARFPGESLSKPKYIATLKCQRFTTESSALAESIRHATNFARV